MKEQVSDLYSKIQGESGGLENLLSKVPGLSGYMEKGKRREADQILRENVAKRLEETRLQLGNVQSELSRDIIKAMDHAEPLGRVDTGLRGLIGKIKDAPQGYAGFFDAVKVKEDDLARIYSFDEGMLNFADQIQADVDALSKATYDNGDIGGAIRTLNNTVQEANRTWANRDEVILGIS
jgi:hypothetical protein